jgi:hypothetical protein
MLLVQRAHEVAGLQASTRAIGRSRAPACTSMPGARRRPDLRPMKLAPATARRTTAARR